MPKKEDLLDKFNMKNYNNMLEQVLESKDFSSDTKNFLLSMLYKIETSYGDYKTVKCINRNKGEFTERIIDAIKNNCDSIELIRPLDEEYSEFADGKEKCKVDYENRKIKSLCNEQYLLYAISKMSKIKFKTKNEIIKEPLEELLNEGRSIDSTESIRDFDGWAWHVEPKLIPDIECNLIFQNLLMLVDDNYETEQQLRQALRKIYSKEREKDVFSLICKIALIFYFEKHDEKIDEYKEYMYAEKEKLDKMENKIEYLKEITEQRKQIEDKIKSIDRCLTDINLLKKEYAKANEKLDDDEKILTVSSFTDVLQSEKEQFINDLQVCNQKMMPEGYLKEKNKIKERLNILAVLDEDGNKYDYILKLQHVFIEGLQNKIGQVQTRSDVMEIIYKIRYYKFIPFEDGQIKDSEELQNDISRIEKLIYNVACKLNVLNVLSINNKTNTDVISEILNTKIVELENIELQFKAEDYQIKLNIFDEENLEKTLDYDTIEGLTVKINKKFRLFIK